MPKSEQRYHQIPKYLKMVPIFLMSSVRLCVSMRRRRNDKEKQTENRGEKKKGKRDNDC